VSPAARPLRLLRYNAIEALFQSALSDADGVTGAHCVHERWMRGDMSASIERALEQLWRHADDSIPDWLPMRHIQWLPQAYEVSATFRADAGRSNIYLVLLDYSERGAEPHGVYVGMSHYAPGLRFDQHKAGIRAAGSVLKRGLEVLTGPTLHLQQSRAKAAAKRLKIQAMKHRGARLLSAIRHENRLTELSSYEKIV
jgi:hypothetical protein